jgi:hypothetical protein
VAGPAIQAAPVSGAQHSAQDPNPRTQLFVLIELAPVSTSLGMFVAVRGQNQTLTSVDERSIA